MKKFFAVLFLLVFGTLQAGTLTIIRSIPAGKDKVRLLVRDDAGNGKVRTVSVIMDANDAKDDQKVTDAVTAEENKPIPTPAPQPAPRVIKYDEK